MSCLTLKNNSPNWYDINAELSLRLGTIFASFPAAFSFTRQTNDKDRALFNFCTADHGNAAHSSSYSVFSSIRRLAQLFQ